MTLNRLILILTAVLTLAAAAQSENIGTVVSTVDAGIYTYVELQIEGKPVWFAVPTTELKAGEKVDAPAGMAMKDFHSETLNRTFDLVYFADGLSLADTPAATGALPPGHPAIQSGASPSPACFDFSSIEKPAEGKTVAEVYQESATLAGKPVTVRGIAIKVTNDIMGKNWIHLRDGTGEAGSNDLTLTTLDTVEPGTTITASGILAKDLDFGAGYTYAVLLENSEVKAE